MRIFKVILITFLIFIAFSCGNYLLPDLEIKSFFYDSEKIQITFSDIPTPQSVYNSFLLLEDGENCNGIYKFGGKTVFFYPNGGIKEKYDYVFSIESSCETSDGNSLESRFIISFSTRNGRNAPEIISVIPSNEEECKEQPEYIEITFSEPIDISSFEKALSITPFIDYILNVSDSEDKVFLILKNPLDFNKDYKISISTDLMDKNRNKLLHPYNSIFSLTKKYTKPKFFCTVYNNKTFYSECSVGENLKSVPPDAKLKLDFDAEMDLSSISSYIEVTPHLSFSVSKDEINSKWVEILLKDPEWGKTYVIDFSDAIKDIYSNKIEEDFVYSLTFDNESFRLPEFIEGYLQTGNWSDGQIDSDDYLIISDATNYSYLSLDALQYPLEHTVESVLYLVFSSSSESNGLNLYTLMDNFSISCTNSNSTFIIKKISKLDSSEFQNYPLCNIITQNVTDSTLKLTVVKYDLEITNSINSGIVQFIIDSGIQDSIGNESIKKYTYKYNK